MTEPDNGVREEFYVWTAESCPVRILLSLSLIERIQAEILAAESRPGEVGGLLIRSKGSQPGTVRIVDFIPLAAEPTPDHFRLPGDFIAEAIARCPSDTRIAGYYRTDIGLNIRLRPEDQEIIQKWFKDRTSIFLVIANARAGASKAGFFFWSGDKVPVESALTFPFFPARLAGEGWPIHIDSVERITMPARIARGWQRTLDGIRRASVAKMAGVIAVLVALSVGIRILMWNFTPTLAHLPAASFQLRVERAANSFVVTWNPLAKEIAKAKEATLVIWDDSRQQWDRSSEPLYMPLNPKRLSLGVISYTPFSFTEKIKFRLDVMDASGNVVSESAISVAQVPPVSK